MNYSHPDKEAFREVAREVEEKALLRKKTEDVAAQRDQLETMLVKFFHEWDKARGPLAQTNQFLAFRKLRESYDEYSIGDDDE